MLAWYLLYSKPRQEGVAVENLKRQGYETYLPLVRTRRRRQGQYVSLVEPMFPRYLFIHLSDQTDNWGPIRSTRAEPAAPPAPKPPVDDPSITADLPFGGFNAENGFDASAVVPSPSSARFCSAAGVVPTQPDPS